MYYQQTKNNILIRDRGGNEYADTLENANEDGFTIPFFDGKFDYRIYEMNDDGTHKRHVLSGNNGMNHEGGEIPWRAGDEAFVDVVELIKRKKAREEKALNETLEYQRMRMEADDDNAAFDNKVLLDKINAEYNNPQNVATRKKQQDDADKALIDRLSRLGYAKP